MTSVRLGAVEYLNARPLVFGLDRDPAFDLRFDVPARCAELLHEGGIDVGLIPSIEYLRGPGAEGGYRIVPELAIASRGPVASVAIYTTRPIAEVRSIALDTSSRTSVALTRVLCRRVFGIDPALRPHRPDLAAMLLVADAALLIGDKALLTESRVASRESQVENSGSPVEKIDLGEGWTRATGLPFVYAFWAGRPDALEAARIDALGRARDEGLAQAEAVSRAYFSDPAEQALGARYLRDNIWYFLGEEERAGLELFYRYAHELDLVPRGALRFY
jgi:chorismate dehydratase